MIIEKEQGYLHTIDLLRGIAALVVCYYHFTNNTGHYGHYGHYLGDNNWLRTSGNYGWLGVEMFFVISGFVIPYSMYKSNYKPSNIISFIQKRWIRIEPPYIITIFLILLNWKFNGWLWSYPVDINWKQVLSHFFYLPQFLGYGWINEIFWTLAIEFQFYLFMALFFFGFNHQKMAVRLISCAAFMLPFYFSTDNRLLTSYASLFLMGMAAFWLKTSRINTGIYLLLTAIFASFAYFQFPDANISIPMVAVITSLAISFTNLKTAFGTFFGRISYSLYLTHGLVGGNFLFFSMYLTIVKDHEPVRNLLIFLALILSVGFAFLFYKMIEKPSQNLSKKIQI